MHIKNSQMGYQILQPLLLLFTLLFSSHVLAIPLRQSSIGFPHPQIALFGPSTANAVQSTSAHDDWGPVPGISPVRFNQDPDTFLFNIEELDMHPNPCVIESYCGVKLQGTFLSDISNAHLSVNITTHFSDNRTGGMQIEDAFKGWADVVQDGVRQDVPRKGKATVEATTLILGGWVPEANYTVDVRVTADEGLVWDLWTQFELKTKD